MKVYQLLLSLAPLHIANVSCVNVLEFPAEGMDFMALNLTTDFDGDSVECLGVNITILEDEIFEDSEAFIVLAEYVNSSNVTVHTSAIVTILDNDSESKVDFKSFT